MTAFCFTRIAREPNWRVPRVSEPSATAGLTHSRRLVLQFPPRLSCSSRVSDELRKGTKTLLPGVHGREGARDAAWSLRAEITFPSSNNERFIFCASCSVAPVAAVRLTRSEPARSTSVSRADTATSPPRVACFRARAAAARSSASSAAASTTASPSGATAPSGSEGQSAPVEAGGATVASEAATDAAAAAAASASASAALVPTLRCTVMTHTACERDEWRFIRVSAKWRRRRPKVSRSRTSCTCVAKCVETPSR